MAAKKATTDAETVRFVDHMERKGIKFPYTTTVYEDDGRRIRVTLEQSGKKVGTKTPWKV